MLPINDRARTGAYGLGIGLFALGIGKLSAERPGFAIKLVVLPLLVVALVAPAVPVVMGVGLLPFQINVLGFGGLQVSASDALLFIGFGGVVLAVLSGHQFRPSSVGPIMPAVAVYFGALTVAWVNLPTIDGVVTIIQRVELIVAALVVGAFLAQRDMLDRALTFYVLSAATIAVTAIALVLVLGQNPEGYLGAQKNPAGQSIANALLIVLFHRRIPARIPLGTLLAVGLIAAQSRGAILATLIALGVAAALASSSRRSRALAVVPVLVGVFYAGYSALPAAQQERLVNVAPGGDVATETRENYADDAIVKIKSAPFLGTGVGLYESGSQLDLTYTNDPHNVLLLELAEGGIVLGAGFGVLALSSWWVLVTRRHRHSIVICALAVQLSSVIHGVVDVYWVRGTPVMGWVLVGAALMLARRNEEAVEKDRDASESVGHLT